MYEDASLAVQLDDMNPGITPDGLFWTMAIPQDSVEVELREGRASMEVERVKVRDYGNFTNSLSGGPFEPATLSFEVRWFGKAQPEDVFNPSYEVSGEFIRNSAQMEWTATVGQYKFVSRPAHTSSSLFAELARERNGVFFRNRP